MGFAVEEPLQPFMGRKERRRSSAGKLFLGGTTHAHRALVFGTTSDARLTPRVRSRVSPASERRAQTTATCVRPPTW